MFHLCCLSKDIPWRWNHQLFIDLFVCLCVEVILVGNLERVLNFRLTRFVLNKFKGFTKIYWRFISACFDSSEMNILHHITQENYAKFYIFTFLITENCKNKRTSARSVKNNFTLNRSNVFCSVWITWPAADSEMKMITDIRTPTVTLRAVQLLSTTSLDLSEAKQTITSPAQQTFPEITPTFCPRWAGLSRANRGTEGTRLVCMFGTNKRFIRLFSFFIFR